MNNNELIESFLDYYSKRLAKSSIPEYRRDLTRLGKRHDLLLITPKQLQDYINLVTVGKRLTNRKLSVFRTFYNYLEDQELIEVNPTKKIRSLKISKHLPKTINDSTYGDIIQKSDSDLSILTMITVMYHTGIRLEEAIKLNVVDIDHSKHQMKVTGKGDKQRVVLYPEKIEPSIQIYLESREKTVSPGEAAFFIDPKGVRYDRNGIEYAFHRISKKLGFEFHPHILRHSFATNAINRGMNLAEVQVLLGHENIATTGIYIHITGSLENSYRKAFELAKKEIKEI